MSDVNEMVMVARYSGSVSLGTLFPKQVRTDLPRPSRPRDGRFLGDGFMRMPAGLARVA